MGLAAVMTFVLLPARLLAAAQEPEPASIAAALVPEPVLVAPTQGRPAFAPPDGTLRVVLQFPTPPGNVSFELVSTRFPPHRHPLPSRLVGDGGDAGTLLFDVAIPTGTPEETYDLRVAFRDQVLTGRHAVAVWKADAPARLVHLSNMNVGELGVPDFDERLIPEVNLLGPTLIVATGDFLDATLDDLEDGWKRLLGFLAAFDAPVLVACGDHDALAHYCRYLAPGPVGAITVGPYRGIVLYDLPTRPIQDDPAQISWIEGELAEGQVAMKFVLAHDECPNLLRYWQEQGVLDRMVRGGQIGVWFSGGHRDWDGREYHSIIEGAGRLLYIRTHQSSNATRDGATGVSHYRVLDLDGDSVVLYGPEGSLDNPPSIPVGRLRTNFEGPNDGCRPRVSLTAVSTLPFRINNLTTQVLVARNGPDPPWCHGARLDRLIEHQGMWECWVKFDLPDNGSRRIVVGTGRAPFEPPVEVHFVVPESLILQPASSEDDVYYLSADGWYGVVQLQNRGEEAVEVMPLVRLDGEPVAYRVVDKPGPVASAYRLRLNPFEVLSLQLDMSAVRVAPGRRELQVYLKGGTAQVPICTPLKVTVAQR